MTNADKFKNIFGLYATELWSMPEKDFLKWLNSEAMNCSEFPNNSDTISRQAAINALDKRFDSIPTEQTTEILLLRKDLREMPSVQPRKGKWMPHNEKSREYIGTVLVNVEYDYWLCDTCGYRVEKRQPMYNFCPNCGSYNGGKNEA